MCLGKGVFLLVGFAFTSALDGAMSFFKENPAFVIALGEGSPCFEEIFSLALVRLLPDDVFAFALLGIVVGLSFFVRLLAPTAVEFVIVPLPIPCQTSY